MTRNRNWLKIATYYIPFTADERRIMIDVLKVGVRRLGREAVSPSNKRFGLIMRALSHHTAFPYTQHWLPSDHATFRVALGACDTLEHSVYAYEFEDLIRLKTHADYINARRKVLDAYPHNWDDIKQQAGVTDEPF